MVPNDIYWLCFDSSFNIENTAKKVTRIQDEITENKYKLSQNMYRLTREIERYNKWIKIEIKILTENTIHKHSSQDSNITQTELQTPSQHLWDTYQLHKQYKYPRDSQYKTLTSKQ